MWLCSTSNLKSKFNAIYLDFVLNYHNKTPCFAYIWRLRELNASHLKKKKIPVISQIKAREIPLTETGQGNLEGTH